MRHPSGSKPSRKPAHPKKPSKPESQKKSPNKKKPPAKEKKKAPPPPPEEDEDDDDDDDGSEGGSSSSYEEVEYEESEEEDGEFTDDPSVAATPRGTPRAAQTPKAAAKAKQAAKPAAKPRPAAPAKAKAGKARPAAPPKDPQPPKAFHRAAKVVKKKPKAETDPDPPSAPPSGPPSGGGSAAPSDISTVRTESIKELLKGRPGSSGERNRTNLGQVKLEVFKGDRAHYRNWIKTIQAQRQLYQLQDEELAVLMFLSFEGEAREVLNQLEIEDMRSAGGLNRVLRLLEDAYGAKADERFEEKQSEFMSYRRGQSVAAYLATLKRLRTEYLKEDPGSVISDRRSPRGCCLEPRSLAENDMMCSLRPEVRTSLLTLNECFASGAVNFTWMSASPQLIEKTAQHQSAGRRLGSRSSEQTAGVLTSRPAIHTGRMQRTTGNTMMRRTPSETQTMRIWSMKPSWQKKTCRKKRHMKMMRATTMMMTRTWTRWIEVPSKKLSPPAGQPSPRRPNNAKAVATRQMANQKVKERAKASDHQIPGPPMPGRRTPPVPAVANEAIGRVMRYAQMSAQVKMQFTRSGTMRPISIRALTRGSVIPQQDPPGQ